MRLKKINAVLGLATSIFLIIHSGFSAYCYAAFYYNPVLKYVFAVPLAICVSLHAALGMLAVTMQSDGTGKQMYYGLNRETSIQRISAALIFPLLIIHLYTFRLIQLSAGRVLPFGLILLSEVLFYAAVYTHVAVSVPRAFITLGLLSDIKKKQSIDRAMYIICAACFAVCVIAVCRGQMLMMAGQ